MSGVDLADFLRARIAEDEDAARRAMQDPSAWLEAEAGVLDFNVRMHVQEWPPPRILAECEAKRRLIGLLDPERWDHGWGELASLLHTLALPYADHPDYRQERKP